MDRYRAALRSMVGAEAKAYGFTPQSVIGFEVLLSKEKPRRSPSALEAD